MLLPLGREILPEHPDICSGMNAASESATLFMEARRRSDRLRAAMGCDHVPGVSRAVPHHGERPCRTRRLRFHLSKGIRHGRIPIWSGTSREILPPDASGTDRIKLSSGGLGGGRSMSYRSLLGRCEHSEIFNEPSVLVSASTGRLLLPGSSAARGQFLPGMNRLRSCCSSLLKSTLMKTNFNVNLNSIFSRYF